MAQCFDLYVNRDNTKNLVVAHLAYLKSLSENTNSGITREFDGSVASVLGNAISKNRSITSALKDLSGQNHLVFPL